eukprot:7383165-Pyramimonas_sp.AAC.1
MGGDEDLQGAFTDVGIAEGTKKAIMEALLARKKTKANHPTGAHPGGNEWEYGGAAEDGSGL